MTQPRIHRRTVLASGTALAVTPRWSVAADDGPAAVPEGYTGQISYTAGDLVDFHISSRSPFDVEIARLGATRDVVWKREALPAAPQPIPVDASSHGCRWRRVLSVPVDPSWRSGYYAVRMTGRGTGQQPPSRECFFVVRPKHPGKNAKILLQLATNTYNAYTNWGGYSLYAYNGLNKVQGRRVSFNRPQHSQFNQWEAPFVAWAEAHGYTFDYCVNSDLELRPEILAPYKLVLSVGHDEYWSSPMRDHLEAFIGKGGNVAFLSGNTCCWQVRTEEKGRALASWKQSLGDDPYYLGGDHKLLTTLWSHYLVGRPENQMTGVGFLWGGYHRSHGQLSEGSGAFTVHRPDHWLLEGTGVKRGDTFGARLPSYKIVGYECDGCELEWKDGLPHPTHTDGTPDNFEVLATAPARWSPEDSEFYERWQKGRVGQAVIGSYTRGGTVVTVGTTDWSHGLRGNDPVVMRVTRNVLDRLGV